MSVDKVLYNISFVLKADGTPVIDFEQVEQINNAAYTSIKELETELDRITSKEYCKSITNIKEQNKLTLRTVALTVMRIIYDVLDKT